MTRMTLAAITQRIARIKGDIATLDAQVPSARYTSTTRSDTTGVVSNTVTPSRSYASIETEHRQLTDQLERLEVARAVANATTKVEYEGQQVYLVSLITRAQTVRSELSRLVTHLAWGSDQPETVTIRPVSVGNTHVEYVDTTVFHILKPEVRERIVALQDEFEKLNSAINHTNHVTVLTFE